MKRVGEVASMSAYRLGLRAGADTKPSSPSSLDIPRSE